MNTTFKSIIDGFEFGEPATVHGVTVVPVFSQYRTKIDYLTMEEAIAKKVLQISEVSSGGSVGELRAVNLSDLPILLLDGEEVIGAKQNRSFNITILLKEKSVTTIPVSCVERGRWHFRTIHFDAAPHMIPLSVRAKKAESVTHNIAKEKRPVSDQHRVWAAVSELHYCLDIPTKTEAVDEVYEYSEKKAEEFVEPPNENFVVPKPEDFKDLEKVKPGQIGAVILIDGKPVLFETLPKEDVFKKFYGRIIKSAIVEVVGRPRRAESSPEPEKLINIAKGFVVSFECAQESEFSKIGYGTNYRYIGDHCHGSALVYNSDLIHAALFGD